MSARRISLAGLTFLHLFLLRGEVPWWIGLAGAALLAGSFAPERIFPPRRWGAWTFRLSPQLEALAGLFALAIGATIRPLVSLEASTALIYLLLPLQHFQIEARRTQWRLLFLWIFSLGLIVLGSQGFLAQVLMILDLVVIFYWMSVFQLRTGQLSFRGLRSALLFVALSLPLWLAIFLVFPRFTLELWGTSPSVIGFAETLEPGSVERLVATNEVALRVRFPRAEDGARTRGRLHYFRGTVMTLGEGLSWRVDKNRRWSAAPGPAPGAPEILQEIWARPEHGRALFALEGPRALEAGNARVEMSADQVFRLAAAAARPTYYRALSTGERAGEPAAVGDAALVPLSEELRAEVRAWMERHPEAGLPASGGSGRVVEVLRNLFQGFRYSLAPTPLAGGGLVAFLERTRNGFCEHFAAATATLLRYHGIPARVVAGYLGGRKDPFGDDLIVMSRDAHAWVEYLDENSRAWTRLDPTLWAEPLRWELGSELNWMTEGAREQLRRLGGEGGAEFLPWWLVWEEKGRLAWDATVGSGERFVYSYQARWLEDVSENLGVPAAANVVGIGLLMVITGALGAVLPRLRRYERGVDSWTRLWRRFGKKVGADFRFSYGELAQWETARAGLSAAGQRSGDEFVTAYLRARYREGAAKPDAQLRRSLARFSRDG